MKKIRYRGHIYLHDDFTIPISWLSSHVFVSGIWRIGGQEFLQKIARDVSEQYPDLGVLYISQLTKGMKESYPWDYYYDILDRDQPLPYFYGTNQNKKDVKQWVAAIARPLGFSESFEDQFKEYFQSVELPERLLELFEGFRKIVFESKSLTPEDYYMIPYLSKWTEHTWCRHIFTPDTKKLNWIEQLQSGKNVFLDITEVWNQPFYTSLVLQNLRARIPEKTSHVPRVLIFIEQGAYQMFSRSSIHGIDYERYNSYIDDILKSFKRKGISLLVESDQPNDLLESVLNNADLKVFFRLWYPSTEGLALGEDELKLIHDLANKEALIYSND